MCANLPFPVARLERIIAGQAEKDRAVTLPSVALARKNMLNLQVDGRRSRSRALNVLFASSEVVPFAKTGGLADVSGSLPVALARLGVNASVIMPAYRSVRHCGLPLEPTNVKFDVPIGSKIVRGRLLRSQLPDSHVPVYLVEQDEYYDRPELYRHRGEDYKDNCERYVFFCRAVLEAVRLLDLHLDVLHCNDWQTGLIPAYLRIEYGHTPGYEQISSLLTIHNIAYQGQFWHWDMLLTGIDWKYFNWRQMEFYGGLNLLKTGLVFADAINTVSPTYAEEIKSAPLGCGLEGVLQQRASVLSGIVNGVDYDVWNPATDPHIETNYDEHTWRSGKAACKAALQRTLGLPEEARTPVIGLVGRLAEQKGWDLVADVMRRWVREQPVQWAILGTGEPHFQELLGSLSREFPHRVAAKFEFGNALAHQIEAGSDLFLMASRYEPCGLNQLYSLKYGTVPVVRGTGGLVDTIIDAGDQDLADPRANGFRFEQYDPAELERTLQRALGMYHQRPDLWERLCLTGMKQDWSWSASAHQYMALYQAMQARRETAVAS
jgi:starch synthase